jgi:hypothetical protein
LGLLGESLDWRKKTQDTPPQKNTLALIYRNNPCQILKYLMRVYHLSALGWFAKSQWSILEARGKTSVKSTTAGNITNCDQD